MRNLESPVSGTLKHDRQSGFTLVELMVVLSLILILVTILLPTIGRVRAAAQRAGCVGNLRQLGGAFLCYVSDNDRRLPDTEDIGAGSDDWLCWLNGPQDVDKSALAKYFNGHLDPALLRCPADPDPEHRPVTWIALYPYSYAFNTQLYFMDINQIQKPGQKCLLVDVELADNTRYYYFVSASSSMGGAVERLSERHMPYWNPRDTYNTSIQAGQRKGLANVLFADFHVGQLETSHDNDPENWAAYPGQPNRYDSGNGAHD